MWVKLQNDCNGLVLDESEDTVKWTLNSNVRFDAKSFYQDLGVT